MGFPADVLEPTAFRRKVSNDGAYKNVLVNANTTSSAVYCAGYMNKTLEVRNGAAEDCDWTVEGGFLRTDGTITWYTLATRLNQSVAFATAALNVAASTNAIYEIAPMPAVHFIRVNVSDGNTTNGTNFTFYFDI